VTASFYGEKALVFGTPQTREQIAIDVMNYNERWPVRRDSVKGEIHLEEHEADRRYTARYLQAFYTESAARAVWMKGEVSADMQIEIVGGVPKISSINHKTISKQQGQLSASQGGKPTAPLRGIPVAGNPGLVHSPYAPTKPPVDVRKLRKGAQAKCPYTGKLFIVP
jgi:hypothetical protein